MQLINKNSTTILIFVFYKFFQEKCKPLWGFYADYFEISVTIVLCHIKIYSFFLKKVTRVFAVITSTTGFLGFNSLGHKYYRNCNDCNRK